MKQVTLIMLYGPKPSILSRLIIESQEQISRMLGDYFQPYAMDQIHATLVDLRRASGSTMFNLNLERQRERAASMDFAGLLDFLRLGGHFPLQVQIGGFENRDYPFVSQGQRPYERSFSIVKGEVAVALMIGWPIRGNPAEIVKANPARLMQEGRIYPTVLDQIRQSFQSFNILHRYHSRLTDVDNDFYFRIGLIHQPSTDYLLQERVENTIRHFLSTLKPTIVEITISDIYLASYQDETLPLDSTQIWPIDDDKVTPEFIQSLYE
ncbi:MAG TPA: hypothetical protein VL485_17075 [Ktedonobacteraceae bacterium]|jgi:hypothetical protein|nr:hypothetical protein [Ktedonobacteraceae bacterium]